MLSLLHAHISRYFGHACPPSPCGMRIFFETYQYEPSSAAGWHAVEITADALRAAGAHHTQVRVVTLCSDTSRTTFGSPRDLSFPTPLSAAQAARAPWDTLLYDCLMPCSAARRVVQAKALVQAALQAAAGLNTHRCRVTQVSLCDQAVR